VLEFGTIGSGILNAILNPNPKRDCEREREEEEERTRRRQSERRREKKRGEYFTLYSFFFIDFVSSSLYIITKKLSPTHSHSLSLRSSSEPEFVDVSDPQDISARQRKCLLLMTINLLCRRCVCTFDICQSTRYDRELYSVVLSFALYNI
jgi:hypothetical protein